MKIFNTLTRQKEELVALEEGKIKIYTCGPTVYNFIHIGNARPICVFDTFRRYLEYRGYAVTFVQNFTDIDDKLIRRAAEEGLTVKELAEKYIMEYRTDAQGLGAKEATIHPRATENIDAIVSMISVLIDKGYAYPSGGDVYFRAKRCDGYGKLSHMPIEDLTSGARISVNEQKEDPLDFALWKAAKPGEPAWDTPWGSGRPGWHIECSAMVYKYLGDSIDIHCGGQDLVFPHHENEIAQSECCTGRPLARYWMHNGYLNIDNKKMSKSTGNFFTTREVAAQYGYMPIRFMMLSAHYRSPLNYSGEIVEQAVSALHRIANCRGNLLFALQNAKQQQGEDAAVIEHKAKNRTAQFCSAMDDDLNTADALGAVFELVKELNIALQDGSLYSAGAIGVALGTLEELCGVLGLSLEQGQASGGPDDAQVEALIEARAQAKKAKDFARADLLRDQLKEMGITLEDTREGVKWKRD